MRFLFFFFIAGLVVSCNFNRQSDTHALSGKITKQHVIRWLPAFHFGRLGSIEKSHKAEESFKLKAGIITHSRFLFLEFADKNEVHTDILPELTADFQFNQNAVQIFDAEHTPAAIRYDQFLGRTVRVFDDQRNEQVYKISHFIYVMDYGYHEPYFAAVLDIPAESGLYHGWATTNKKLNPFPFTEVEDQALHELALTHFDSLTERERFETAMMTSQDSEEIYGDELYVWIFEGRKNEKYIFVQSVYRGNCDAIRGTYAALYHVTRDNWVQEAEGEIPHLFDDLVDLDGDLYPEFLMINFTTTSIYEINYKGFDEVESMTWSTTECPC